MKRQIYMDYAAATPLSNKVLRAMEPLWQEDFYNPSGIYLSAKKVRSFVEQARADVAKVIGARSSEITFTAGGSEANNLAITGVMQKHPNKKLLVSAVEHDSIHAVAEQYSHALVPVDQKGRVIIEKLQEMLDDDTVLVSVMLANNEIGTVQPVKEIARIINETRKDRLKNGNKTPLYLHTDACQAANYLDIHIAQLGADMMTLNGGKIYGPKQTGCLYVRAGIELEPVIYGGGQEHGLRSGTENTPGVVGFAAALVDAQSKRASESKRLRELQEHFVRELEKIPDAVINGSKKHRLPNNVNVLLPGADNERLLMELDERGVLCATGSACSASKEASSRVLLAIGLSDEEARASLRFTMGRKTTRKDIDTVAHALRELASD